MKYFMLGLVLVAAAVPLTSVNTYLGIAAFVIGGITTILFRRYAMRLLLDKLGFATVQNRQTANLKTPLQEFAQSNPRFTGVFALLFGAAFLYFSVVKPVLEAQVGSHIHIIRKGVVSGGLFAILGVLLILFGSRALSALRSSGPGSKIAVYSAAGVLGLLGYFAFESLKTYLRSKGYVI